MIKPVVNPPNPYARYSVEWLDVPPRADLRVFEEQAATIISENNSPDVGFRYSINPYRGCFHACAYCYARPTHQYLDFGAGSDFERNIVVKLNAAQRLREAFEKPSWKGDCIAFSGVTDCYQPLEASYEITRSCLQVCVTYRNPVAIITKGALVRRDVDLLRRLTDEAGCHVTISLAFIDDALSKLIEPHAPRPSVRLRAIDELASAGIPVGIGLAPVIVGLNDTQIPDILKAAKAAGATSAFLTVLRLPREVETVFFERLHEAVPQRAKKIENGLRAVKEGRLNRPEFGKRMSGEGARWEAIKWLFRSNCDALGIHYGGRDEPERPSTFRRPRAQLELF